MSLIAEAPETADNYVDVTFRCGTARATTAVTLQLRSQSVPENGYQIAVYGFMGFDPVIRLGGDDGSSGAPCEASAPVGEHIAFEFGLGESGDFTFTHGDVTGVARLDVPPAQAESVRITVGSRDGASGYFALHISGLAIESANDADSLIVRSGPFAKDES